MSVKKTLEYTELKEKGLLPTKDDGSFRGMPRPVTYEEWDGKSTKYDEEAAKNYWQNELR